MANTDQIKGELNMVVALPLEAKPIIQHYNLDLFSASPFKVYADSGWYIRLIISGIGKVSAGAATAHLASLSKTTDAAAWLNIGVAGHKNLPVGSIVTAHEITDAGNGRSWSLDRNLDLKIRTKPILTFDEETHNYPDDDACDMEASGFYQSAIRFSSRKLIHCIKIISDNEHNSEINYQEIGKLIKQNLSTIESTVKYLLKLSAEQSELEKTV